MRQMPPPVPREEQRRLAERVNLEAETRDREAETRDNIKRAIAKKKVALAKKIIDPPPPPPSVFAGAGLFTAWDPGIILRRRPKVDWIAVTTDIFNGAPGCSPTMSAQLRAAGYRVHVWESRMEKGDGACIELGCEGYIGQAESNDELRSCLQIVISAFRPRALVGNPTAWEPEKAILAQQTRWELLLEGYWNEQPSLQPDSRGYPVTSYVVGLYPGAAGRRTLAEYREHWPWLQSASWSGYVAEEMAEEDWALIGAKT